MGFFDIFKKQEPEKFSYSVDSVKFTLPELPLIKEVKGKDWIYYGEDNLYPQHLKRIVVQSPTQGAVIKGKAGMMAGDGILVNSASSLKDNENILNAISPAVKAEFDKFIDNPNNSHDLNDIITMVCHDYEMFGAFAMEVVWSMDFTKVVTIKYVDVADIRSGKFCGSGRVDSYYYSRNWALWNKDEYAPVEIAAFDETNKEDYNQLIYVKTGNLDYYGEPAYIQGISYVELEGKIANFHLSNINNAFAPSMAMKFYQKPGSPEEQKMTVRGIERAYSGTGNAGRAMIFFSDGKDLAPDIAPIPVSDLHQQYIAINNLAVQNILTSNQVTSPLLFGISTSGQLGGNTELSTAYQIFNSSVIEPDRKKLERVLNDILAINQVPIKISIQPFNPLFNANSENTGAKLAGQSPLVATKILEYMTQDEVRAIIDLPPAPQQQAPVTPPTNPAA